MPFPFGDYQILRYAGRSVRLEADQLVYRVAEGEGWLKWLGYDRWRDPDYESEPKISSSGMTFNTGPSFPPPFRFEWRLTKLPERTFFNLEEMVEDALSNETPIRLIDARFALSVRTPRVRAKINTINDAPTTPGREYIWPQFNITLKLNRGRGLFKNQFDLEMNGIEHSPGQPIHPDDDLP
jgi:hypothetical protein